MCPSEGNQDSRILPRNILIGNPLYEYLVDLQARRINLVETLAPRRHLFWQGWLGGSLIILWLIDFLTPVKSMQGFPVAMLILLGPLFLLGGLYIAGWHAQMLAVKNYPSPFDLPRSLELLLSTPLTEVEIVTGTVGAFLRYPFVGLSWKPIALVVFNFALLVLILLESNSRGILPVDVLSMSLRLYLPALCVFIYFPLLTALDLLLVPSSWLRRQPRELTDGHESMLGRSGRLPAIAMILALLPVIYKINQQVRIADNSLTWVIGTACPVIIVGVGVAAMIVIFLLPGHLEKIRRG